MYVVRVPRIVFPPAVTDSVSTMVTSAADATTEERAIARRSAARIWPPRQLMRIAIIRAARRSFRRAWPRDTQIPNPESLPRLHAFDDEVLALHGRDHFRHLLRQGHPAVGPHRDPDAL